MIFDGIDETQLTPLAAVASRAHLGYGLSARAAASTLHPF
jgi:hypothetical protein